MRTVREGKNAFTCMPDNSNSPGNDPMCLDKNAMAWAIARGAKKIRHRAKWDSCTCFRAGRTRATPIRLPRSRQTELVEDLFRAGSGFRGSSLPACSKASGSRSNQRKPEPTPTAHRCFQAFLPSHQSPPASFVPRSLSLRVRPVAQQRREFAGTDWRRSAPVQQRLLSDCWSLPWHQPCCPSPNRPNRSRQSPMRWLLQEHRTMLV